MKITDRGFFHELEQLAADLRRDIDAHSTGLDPKPAAVKQRRKRVLMGDFRYFAYTYFPHHIRGEPSRFQAHFLERYPKLLRHPTGLREWWIAPRGEAKTSLANKIGPVWIQAQALLERLDVRKAVGWKGKPPPLIDYVIILGAETRLPTKLLESLKIELTCNPMLALDFPEICGVGPKWKVGEMVTRVGVKIEPYGAEQAIRGTFHGSARPKLLLADDLITDSEAKSPVERENRWSWLERAIDYLGPPDGSVKFVGVGTVLDRDDPISRAKRTLGHTVHHFRAIEQLPDRIDMWEQCEQIQRNSDRAVEQAFGDGGDIAPESALPSFQFYERNRETMDAGAVISWPAVRSLYWLMRQRAKNPRAFSSEMQGEPKREEDQVFGSWQYWTSQDPNWIIIGACDPSVGKTQNADPSAILVGGYARQAGILHVIAASSRRRLPSKLEADLITMQREHRCQRVAFENNAAFEAMRLMLIQNSVREGCPLPLVGITSTVPQQVYVESLEPFLCGSSPRILIHPSLTELQTQLREWPERQGGHHYDLLVALYLLWTVATTRLAATAGGGKYIPVQPRRAAMNW